MRSARTSAGGCPDGISKAPLPARRNPGPSVCVRLGVARLDQQLAELLDVAAQVLLVDRDDGRPELLVAQVGVANDCVVLWPAHDDTEEIAQPLQELGELRRSIGLDGRG